MESFEVDLYNAMKVCDGYIWPDYEKVYTFTTENIAGSLVYFD